MYKFKDKVKIVKGFYKGFTGILQGVDFDIENTNCDSVYQVDILINPEEIKLPYYPPEYKFITVSGEYLEKIK